METVFIIKREEIPHFSKHIISKGYSLFAPVKGESKHYMISEYIGGRAVHPVTLTVGGFSRPPLAERLDEVVKALDSC